MWVAVCAWQALARAAASTAAVTAEPAISSPSVTRTLCTTSPCTGRCTSSTSKVSPFPVIRPESASWPPASA